MSKYTIIIPVYNEKDFITATLEKINHVKISGWEKEVIIVDDGSSDGTKEILEKLNSTEKVFFHQHNSGKGSALKTGLASASGAVIVIQDADCEYDPLAIPSLIQPIINQQSQVIYGTRMLGNNPVGHWRYYLGNILIAKLISLVYGLKITDVETGHKAFLAPIIKSLKLEQPGFGIEVEITAKILNQKIKITEVPIKYYPRKFNQGKKINWRDGIIAIWLIAKYRLSKK